MAFMYTRKFAFMLVLGALVGLTLCHTTMAANGLDSSTDCTAYCKDEYAANNDPPQTCASGTFTPEDTSTSTPAKCECADCTDIPPTTTTTTTTTADPKNDGNKDDDKSAAVSSALVSSHAVHWVGGSALVLALLATAL